MTITNLIPEINLTTVNNQLASGLKRIEEEKLKIETFKEEAKKIEIIDENDKEGYKKTLEFLSKVRPNRISVEKERKSVAEPLNELLKYSNGAYNYVTSAYKEIESSKKSRKEWYEEKLAQRKEEELQAKENAINAKIQQLLEAGLEYDAISGYYKNDMGITVSRIDITNMDDNVLSSLIERALTRKNELIKEREESERLDKLFEERKTTLLKEGMTIGLEGLVITKAETQEQTVISFDDLKALDEFTFDVTLKNIQIVLKANADFKQKQLDAAEETRKKEAALKEAADKLKSQRVAFFQKQLEEFGYRFVYGSTIESGVFAFQSGKHTVNVGEALEDDALIDKAIDVAKKYFEDAKAENEKYQQNQMYLGRIKELNEHGVPNENIVSQEILMAMDSVNFAKYVFEKQEEIETKKKADAAKLKLETDKLEQQRLNAEAKKKVASKKDLSKFDDLIAPVLVAMGSIHQYNFEVIKEYTNTFTSELEAAILKFNNSVQHLRPKN